MTKRGSAQVVTDYLAMMEKEPEDSREAITFSAQYLMVRDGVSLAELADHLKVSRDYMPTKMRDGRWKFEELDAMAELFEVHAGDLLHGPQYIKNLEES
ncbi:hypothetical protein [Streptomyces sp. 5-10]|uniref:hypothetical protein n=1 Tax=Streptomyces sp. 5-10 TaxID=878925 RepID=UPI00168AF158|nr:hypothetical protein [Streptomyces sp. 5-10]MBD3004866.1 hypothetical protein [Streptomyces sp. 5-10]